MPRSPNKRPCIYPGCKAWARRDSDGSLCSAHAHLTAKEQARGTPAAPGSPKRTHGGQPGNQNHLLHGFYSRILHAEDAGDLDQGAEATDLDGEILIVRLALRRAVTMLLSGTSLGENPQPLGLAALISLITRIFEGARTVARLLTVKKDLGAGESLLMEAIDAALDELSAEWDIEL